uniref:tRNA (32-2'-O)-methyltransferase regulator THADA n=1 Tax=Myxine glutinosa TaxID=7769 RepID=UPI00358E865F
MTNPTYLLCSWSNDSREQQKELDLALHLVSTPRACSHNGDLLPLIRSTVQLQLHAFDNLKAFRKLEQILKRLAEWERATVMTELHCHLCRILQPNQILSQVDCLTVSAFLEGSLLGRAVLEDNLQALLKVIACTLSQLLQHPDCLAGELPTCVAKVCMKLFQLLPELLKPLLMIEQNNCENIAAVSSILDFLLQGISKQGLCAEGRLYAGGALPLLLGLACSQSDGAAVIRHMLNMQEPNWVCIGLLKARAPALGRDLTACLTLCRALVTCGKSSLLLSQPQPSTSSDQSDASIQGCLLLADVFSAVCRLCENLQETGYRAFQLLHLWLRRVQEEQLGLCGCGNDLAINPLFSADSSTTKQILQLLFNAWDSLADGVAENARSSLRLLLDLHQQECVLHPKASCKVCLSLLGRAFKMPCQARGRLTLLGILVPHIGAQMVMDTFKNLPQQILSCLATNYLAPAAADLYKVLLLQQRREWSNAQPDDLVSPESFTRTDSCLNMQSGQNSQSSLRVFQHEMGPFQDSESCAITVKAQQEERELGERLTRLWTTYWLEMVTSGLSAAIIQLQLKTSQDLLPHTLKVFPEALAPMSECFSGPKFLQAWLNLMTVAASVLPASQSDKNIDTRMLLGLAHSDDDIRASAFELLSSRPLASSARGIFYIFLRRNLSRGSAPFRQRIQTSARRAFTRVRDNSLCLLRTVSKKMARHLCTEAHWDKELKSSTAWMDSLWTLCVDSLTPDASYQRLRMAMLLLSALLETLSPTRIPNRKKGTPPDDVKMLLKWAWSNGYWDFFSTRSVGALLFCMQDGTDEVREAAAQLLTNHWPIEALQRGQRAIEAAAWLMLCSPKAPKAEAGALLCKFVCERLLLTLPSQELPENNGSSEALLTFLHGLLNGLEKQYANARADVLQAARTKPMHGQLIALRRCLTEVPGSVELLLQCSLSDFLDRLVAISDSISRFILGVLYGARTEELLTRGTAPSFAEMGRAIDYLVAQGHGLDPAGLAGEANDAALISLEHSLVLSCCWLTLKEVGQLLGAIAEKVIAVRCRKRKLCFSLSHMQKEELKKCKEDELKRKDDSTWCVALMKTIAAVFWRILTQCRHRGAIDGCGLGFVKLCEALEGCPEQEFQTIPRDLLQQVLERVGDFDDISSVTRRSAGLPLLTQCLVLSEGRNRGRPLLRHCLDVLLALADAPLPSDHDQTLDLPQVHALNILQTLFRDAVLAAALPRWTGRALVLSVRGMASPSWGVRNASIQLFSTLAWRLVGQKCVPDEHAPQNIATAEDIFGLHPELRGFLLSELMAAAMLGHSSMRSEVTEEACVAYFLAASDTEAQNDYPEHLQPSPLPFPILTLLSKLQPGTGGPDSLLLPFLPSLLWLSKARVYAVREMAAQALVAILAWPSRMNVLMLLIRSLPEGRHDHEVFSHGEQGQAPFLLSQNALHGRILQIKALLMTLMEEERSTDSQTRERFLKMFSQRIWLASQLTVCALSRAAFVDVLSLTLQMRWPYPVRPEIMDVLLTVAWDQLSRASSKPPLKSELQVGVAALQWALVRFIVQILIFGQSGNGRKDLSALLQHGDTEVRLATLSSMLECHKRILPEAASDLKACVTESLSHVLEFERDDRCLRLHLEVFTVLHDAGSTSREASRVNSSCLPPVEAAHCLELLLKFVPPWKEANASPLLSAWALSASSCLVAGLCTRSSEHAAPPPWRHAVESWSSAVELSAGVSSFPELMLGAARSLCLAGPVILRSTSLQDGSLEISTRIVRVAVRLMQAEDEESRMKVAHFVMTLITSPEQSLIFPPDTHQVESHQSVKEAISSLSTLHAIGYIADASSVERNEEKIGLFGRCPALPSEGLEALLCWLSKASPVCPAAFEALCSLVPLHDVFEVWQTSQEPEEKRLVNLFEQEQGNAFEEPTVMAYLAAPWLGRAIETLTSHHSTILPWLTCVGPSACAAVQRLKSMDLSAWERLHPVSWTPKVYHAITLLSLNLELLAQAMDALAGQSLTDVITQAGPEGKLSAADIHADAVWLSRAFLDPAVLIGGPSDQS